MNVEFGEKNSLVLNAEQIVKPKFELFMCLGVANSVPIEPKADFLITDKIYCLVRWHGISVGNHKVEFYWISPKKETQEYYKRAFVVGTSNRYDIWSWLRLREGDFFMDDTFVGRWSVQVFLDGQFITEKGFRVS